MNAAEVSAVFREESGRVVAALVKRFGDIDLAEEVVQDAFLAALDRWPTEGRPPNPGAWITTTAKRRAIDRLRREASRDERHEEATRQEALLREEEDEAVPDERLRLMFTCCHPSLARSVQVALTLRLLGGLETPEIARALLVERTALQQRLVRAKRKIKANAIPYRIPDAEELPERLAAVLAVLYLIFNEGHTATAGDALVREDLMLEAIRMTRVIVALLPNEPEATGLLALMLLVTSRRAARTDEAGAIVLLADQDRTKWDRAMIGEGHRLVRQCLRINRPGPYQIQAAIHAVHTDALRAEDTAWSQIVVLYDQLIALAPSAIVALNRAIALAEIAGPQMALDQIEGLALTTYAPFHATRADLLRRLGRAAEAIEAYDAAIAATENTAEKRFLETRRDALVTFRADDEVQSAPFV